MVASGVAAYGAVDWAVSEYVPGVDLPEKGASAEPVVGEDLIRGRLGRGCRWWG